ncbi:hypothetical protein DITRI_Ditri08aG0023300 [Diplodiscus trichospermus]
MLSVGSKITLLKSVFANLPNYYMSLFQVPATIKDKPDNIQRRFLWGETAENRKNQRVGWDIVCKRKENGGLGIVDFNLKDRALLSKSIWIYSEEKAPYGGRSLMTSWVFWYWVIWSQWGISWTCNNSPWKFFIEWQSSLPKNHYDKVWRMAVCATIWSIWKMRNGFIFQRKRLDVNQILDHGKLYISEWVRAKWPHIQVGFQDIFRYPSYVTVLMEPQKCRNLTTWNKSPAGVFKFNVDGSSHGKPSSAGIVGILRYHLSMEKIRFSKSIGIKDSNVAELLAIREALILYASSIWAQNAALIIESDSKNAVNWVLNAKEPENLLTILKMLKLMIKEWKVVHISRECNRIADGLTKEGVNRFSNLLLMNEE